MRSHIVIESSESFASPSGTYHVAVSSTTYADGQALSQAVVTHHDGGSGLIAFYLPRVSLAFAWNGDDELWVRYPDDLPAPRIDATNASFRGGRVSYEAVPRSQIEPLRWTREAELRSISEKRLERGVLLSIQNNHEREYSYSYYDVREPDSSQATLQAQGFQGGGCSWAGIVRGLAALRAPEILSDLDLDPEGDGLVVKSRNRAALVRLAKLVASAKRDPALLRAATERASQDGDME